MLPMNRLPLLLGMILVPASLLHAQSDLAAPPVEIQPPGQPPAAAPPSAVSSPVKPDRRERRRDRRFAPSGDPAGFSLSELDANKDGAISLEEFIRHEVALAEQHARISFTEQDRNKDGQLSPEELGTPPPSGPSRSRRLGGKGKISAPPPPAADEKKAPNPDPVPVPPGGAVEIPPPGGKRT